MGKDEEMINRKKHLSIYSVISLSLLWTKKTHTGAVKLVLMQIALQ